MKINFACGRQVWDGFYNVDAVRHSKAPRDPELLHAINFGPDGAVLNPLPLEDGCADELHGYHILEHVYRWEAPYLLDEWKRLLKPGGLLVLELPNLEAACRNLLAGQSDQMCLWPFHGDPGPKDPFMCHRWSYTLASIAALLKEGGFVKIKHLPPQTHGARLNRDMRVEARKS